MENLEEAKVVKIIKPDRWVYCKKGEFICYENLLVGKNFILGLERPILEIDVDRVIAVRTEDEVAVLDLEGKVLWRKKVKANALAVHEERVALGVGKRVEIYDLEGKRIFKKRVGRVLALDFDDEIVVATDRGLKCLKLKREIWRLNVRANLVRIHDFIAVANYDEFTLLTRDGNVIWKKKLDNVIYDVEFHEDGVVVLTLGSRVKFGFDGRVVEVLKESYDFKFLPYPQIVLERKFEELKKLLKLSKGMNVKGVKKIVEEAEKSFKEKDYGGSYELLIRALEDLKREQLMVKTPKKVRVNREFKLKVAYKNVLHDIVENLIVDLTDLEKYFEVDRKVVEFPPLRRGMVVSEEVKAVPKFEGLFKVFVNAKSNVDEVSKEVSVRVVRGWFDLAGLFRFKRKEREEASPFEELLK